MAPRSGRSASTAGRAPDAGQGRGLDTSLGPYADYATGGAIATTPAELLSNYQSVIGLEPELTTKVVKGEAPPETLTFIRKPRLAEKHKGGKIWDPAKPGDQCFTLWLAAGPTPTADGGMPVFIDQPCTDELKHK